MSDLGTTHKVQCLKKWSKSGWSLPYKSNIITQWGLVIGICIIWMNLHICYCDNAARWFTAGVVMQSNDNMHPNSAKMLIEVFGTYYFMTRNGQEIASYFS